MATIKIWKTDVSQEQDYVYMKCKQYDHLSRKYRIIFTDRGKLYPINSTKTVEIRMWAEGESEPYVDKFCDWEDGYPVICLTENMLSKIGIIDVDFVIRDPSDGSAISTRNQHINVQKALIDYDGIIESQDFDVLSNLISHALLIPELIESFEDSQNQINELITQFNNDIQSFNNQFLSLKTEMTEALTALIDQVNSDISSYQSDYNSIKTEITELQKTITTWYTTAQNAENTRITNENKRQTDTANAIANCEKATADTNAAISGANTARDDANTAAVEAQKQGAYAQSQGDRVDDALQDFEFRLRTIDGGDITDTTPAENVYDGGSI